LSNWWPIAGLASIECDEEKPRRSIFFHVSDLQGEEFSDRLLMRRVEFEIAETAKGKRATSLRFL
jgi:cold shock CspA family protein